MIAEDVGLAMTSGIDGKTVLYCLESGKTIKVLEIRATCLFGLGSVVAVADCLQTEVRFFDLIKQKMLDIPPIETGFVVLCVQMCIKNSLRNNPHPQSSLFVGGMESTEIMEIILPETITQKSTRYSNSLIK
jgi:hypothetical protein